MEKLIYIFRHGETKDNVKNLWQGCIGNPRLTRRGIKQACNLAKDVKDVNFDILYSSNTKRAIKTAMCIKKYQNKTCNLVKINELHECNFGRAEGKTMQQLYKKYPKIVDAFYYCTKKTWHIKFPGKKSESKFEAFNRINSFLLNTVIKSEYNTIGIVIHAGLLNALSVGLNLKNVSYENCSILILKYTDENKFIQLI